MKADSNALYAVDAKRPFESSSDLDFLGGPSSSALSPGILFVGSLEGPNCCANVRIRDCLIGNELCWKNCRFVRGLATLALCAIAMSNGLRICLTRSWDFWFMRSTTIPLRSSRVSSRVWTTITMNAQERVLQVGIEWNNERPEMKWKRMTWMARTANGILVVACSDGQKILRERVLMKPCPSSRWADDTCLTALPGTSADTRASLKKC